MTERNVIYYYLSFFIFSFAHFFVFYQNKKKLKEIVAIITVISKKLNKGLLNKIYCKY